MCAPVCSSSVALPLLTSVRVVAAARGIAPDTSPITEAVSFFLDRTHCHSVASAARLGSVALLSRLALLRCCGGDADLDDPLVVEKAMWMAAKGGHDHVLEWLLQHHPQGIVHARRSALAGSIINGAMAGSSMDVVKWVLRKWPGTDVLRTRTLDVLLAARLGAIECLECAMAALDDDTKNVPVFAMALQTAAVQGQFAVVKWLHQYQQDQHRLGNPRGQLDTQADHLDMSEVATAGRLDMLQWLHANRPHDLRGPLLDEAATHGHLEIVVWLHEIKHKSCGKCTGHALGLAAKGGHLNVVQWMLQNRSDEFPSHALQQVAFHGHLHVLQYLYDHPQCRELFSSDTTSCLGEAAGSGNLEMVKWLHALQPLVPAWRALDLAATYGHLDVLKWLHQHRPHDSCCVRAMDMAALHGHLDVVKFLHFNRREGCTTDAMDNAASEGHLDIVKFLHAHRREGCTTAAMDGAATKNHWDVVKYLDGSRSEGCTLCAMHSAVRAGNLEMMQYLFRRRALACDEEAVALAMRSGNLDSVQWLVATFPSVMLRPRVLRGALKDTSLMAGLRHVRSYIQDRLHELERAHAGSDPRAMKRSRRV